LSALCFSLDGATCCLLITYQVTCFNNADVEKAVLDALANEGVEINSGYILSAWNDGSENVTEITSASFTSFDQPLRLECIVS
jgi:hypothetical protein